MSHILILDEEIALLEQLHDYSEQIYNNMNTYDKEQEERATSLLADVNTLVNDINTSYRTQLDDQVGALEEFLGI